MVYVNDVHAQLSQTQVHSVAKIRSLEDLKTTLKECRRNGWQISVAGGRHSLGRQPFVTGGVVLNLRDFSAVKFLDKNAGVICFEGGCHWTDLRKHLHHYSTHNSENSSEPCWEIHQKQTGADSMSVAGSIAVNAHGNVLNAGPISSDVLWFKLVQADGSEVFCDRQTNSELFSLAIGGLGLFGIISEIGLQLVPTQSFLRHSTVARTSEAFGVWQASSHPYSYGDMQLNIDPTSKGYLKSGILNLREPITSNTSLARVPAADWDQLLALAHFDKRKAFECYSQHASMANETQETRHDFHWDFYSPDYHSQLENHFGLPRSSEILAEFFIPFELGEELLAAARRESKRLEIDLILATLRSIQKCDVSFLRWAKQDFACLVLAMHTEHTPDSLSTTDAFCSSLCEFCCLNEGSFYLPYRSFASRDQLRTAYPNFDDFLAKKIEYDAGDVFGSDWFARNRSLCLI